MCNDDRNIDINIDHRRWSEKMSPHKGDQKKKKSLLTTKIKRANERVESFSIKTLNVKVKPFLCGMQKIVFRPQPFFSLYVS